MARLKSLFTEALLKKAKEEQGKYKGMLRASELSQCPVKAVWSFLGKEQVINEEKLQALAIGANLHKMLQEYLLVEEAEKEFIKTYKKFRIVGHIDGIMTDETGEKFIVEFKTVADKVYPNGKTTKDYLPSKHHILQVHFYMRLSGLKKATIFYLFKSSDRIEEFDVDYSQEVEKEMFHVLDEAIAILRGEKDIYDVYTQTQSSDSWKCRYCFYSHLCSSQIEKCVK